MIATNFLLAAGKSSSSSSSGGDVVFGVIVFAFVATAVVGNFYVIWRRSQKYKAVVAQVEADPTNWIAIITGHPAPRRPTGPLLFHCGSSSTKNSEHLVAFDDAHLVVQSLRHQRLIELEPWGVSPRYHEGLFAKYLDVLGERIYFGPVLAICGGLEQLGWTVLDAPRHSAHFYGMGSEGNWPKPNPVVPPGRSPASAPPGPQANWRPRPHGHVPGSPTWSPSSVAAPASSPRNPANTPVAPAFSSSARPADARADDLEYGTDDLGDAIDDWIDGDDLEDIE